MEPAPTIPIPIRSRERYPLAENRYPPQCFGNQRIVSVSVLSPYSIRRVEIIQNTYAIVAQDASDSSGLAVLETNVILKVRRHPAIYKLDQSASRTSPVGHGIRPERRSLVGDARSD